MAQVKIRSTFLPMDAVTQMKKRPFAQDFSGDTKTQQHFKDSCDVNNIVAHYQQTGIDPYLPRREAQQFGFASAVDFTQAMQNVAEINSAFAELPSGERSGFANDPARWLAHLAQPDPPEVEKTPSEPPQEASPPEATPPSNEGE